MIPNSNTMLPASNVILLGGRSQIQDRGTAAAFTAPGGVGRGHRSSDDRGCAAGRDAFAGLPVPGLPAYRGD